MQKAFVGLEGLIYILERSFILQQRYERNLTVATEVPRSKPKRTPTAGDRSWLVGWLMGLVVLSAPPQCQ